MSDLRRSLERQASYLIDVVTPDARRRRSRQSLAERFDAGARLVAHVAERRGISLVNAIPKGVNSPPMFPAELATVFSNLLTNAVKAAGDRGRIRASAKRERDGQTVLRVENTGAAVKRSEAERWFQPFESTTATVHTVLGQGMGLGLPITRSVLAEYGASIEFAVPSRGFATAIAITFPKD
jgi:signal transduction histidine kinase